MSTVTPQASQSEVQAKLSRRERATASVEKDAPKPRYVLDAGEEWHATRSGAKVALCNDVPNGSRKPRLHLVVAKGESMRAILLADIHDAMDAGLID